MSYHDFTMNKGSVRNEAILFLITHSYYNPTIPSNEYRLYRNEVLLEYVKEFYNDKTQPKSDRMMARDIFQRLRAKVYGG